jgi:hypothetical protein
MGIRKDELKGILDEIIAVALYLGSLFLISFIL